MELRITLDESGKLDVIAKIVGDSGQVGANIPLTELGTTGVYSGDVGTLVAGVYTVVYEDGTGLLGSGELQWDGTKELNFTNITVNVNVPAETINAAVGTPVLLSDIDGGGTNEVLTFLYDDRQSPILFLVKDYLDSIDKLITEVSAATFMIKANKTDADGDALYSKLLSDPEIVIDTSDSSVACVISDYAELAVGKRYSFVLGLQFPGDIQYREVPVKQKLLEFRQDIIRG